MNALEVSAVRPTAILTDAMPLDLSDTQFNDIPVYYFPKGESKSSSIAAASIVAKVTRDAMMGLYDTCNSWVYMGRVIKGIERRCISVR